MHETIANPMYLDDFRVGHVPQPDMENLQAISVGAYATEANCLTQAGDYGLTRDDAQAIIDAMARQMRGWRKGFAELGVSESTIAKLGRAFSNRVGMISGAYHGCTGGRETFLLGWAQLGEVP